LLTSSTGRHHDSFPIQEPMTRIQKPLLDRCNQSQSQLSCSPFPPPRIDRVALRSRFPPSITVTDTTD
jgi:hypothetical protein